MRAAPRREAVEAGSQLVFTIVLAVTALGVADVLRLDGVPAAFVAGATTRRSAALLRPGSTSSTTR